MSLVEQTETDRVTGVLDLDRFSEDVDSCRNEEWRVGLLRTLPLPLACSTLVSADAVLRFGLSRLWLDVERWTDDVVFGFLFFVDLLCAEDDETATGILGRRCCLSAATTRVWSDEERILLHPSFRSLSGKSSTFL